MNHLLACMLLVVLWTAPAIQVARAGDCDQITRAGTTVDSVERVTRSKDPLPLQAVKVAELNDWLKISFTNLEELMKEAKCRSKPLVVYLNGQELSGLDLTVEPPDHALLQLQRLPLNRDAWAKILGSPGLSPFPVSLAVGVEGELPLVKAASFNMRSVTGLGVILAFGTFGAVLLGFVVLVARSNILRDRSPPESAIAVVNGKLDVTREVANRGPYSLARMQAAWWFFIIVAAYLLIGIVTWDFYSSVSSTALILLGIGAGTVVSGAIIDTSKDTDASRADLAQRAAELRVRIDDLTDAERYCALESQRLDRLAPADPATREPSVNEIAELDGLKSRHATRELWLKANFKPICDAAADILALATMSEVHATAVVNAGNEPGPGRPAELDRLRALYGASDILQLCDAKFSGGTPPGTRVAFLQLMPTERLKREKLIAISRYRKATNQSEGILTDILSDAAGISFHRFQLLIWTAILGVVFIVNTYRELNMPVFDQTLMGLLGLSAATYLGLKVPEPVVPPK